jgi:DNA-binding FadR family transcriptional regulator
MSPSISPIARAPLLHMSVQESVRAYIEHNRLRAGEQLPHEGELARLLNVSRNSVREAVKGLESLGIVEVRRGIGVFVKEFSFETLLDNLAFGLQETFQEVENVLEVRRILEVAMIEEAIEKITPEDLLELRATLDVMKEKASRRQGFGFEDQRFHQLLFRGVNNRVLSRLNDVFWIAFYKAANFANLDDPAPLQTWRAHYAIYEAVLARDLAAARQRLDQHYDGSFKKHMALWREKGVLDKPQVVPMPVKPKTPAQRRPRPLGNQ